MATFDPSILGIFIFGLIAGICPCNSVLYLGLIGYLTSGKTKLTPLNILMLTLSFSLGTILVSRSDSRTGIRIHQDSRESGDRKEAGRSRHEKASRCTGIPAERAVGSYR